MSQNTQYLIPADLLEELTQFPDPTQPQQQLEADHVGHVMQQQEPVRESWRNINGLPETQLPPWDDTSLKDVLAALNDCQQAAGLAPQANNLASKAVNSSETASAESCSDSFKTPTKSPTEPTVPGAPKKNTKRKQQKSADQPQEKAPELSYEWWTMDELRGEFIERFHPPSQKRLNDRHFMTRALIEYNFWQENEEKQKKSEAAAETEVEAKTAAPSVGDSCSSSKCTRCGLVWSWMHVCPPEMKPSKPKHRKPMAATDSLLFKEWLNAK